MQCMEATSKGLEAAKLHIVDALAPQTHHVAVFKNQQNMYSARIDT